VDPDTISNTTLIDAVHKLRQIVSHHFTGFSGDSEDLVITWPSYQGGVVFSPHGASNGFDGLAVQFAIMPYVKHRLQEDPSCLHISSDQSTYEITQTIFSFVRYTRMSTAIGLISSKISRSKHIDLLRCLLLNEVLPLSMEKLLSELQHGSLLADAKSRIVEEYKYKTEVMELFLNKKKDTRYQQRIEVSLRRSSRYLSTG
jgi:hypothetical protein